MPRIKLCTLECVEPGQSQKERALVLSVLSARFHTLKSVLLEYSMKEFARAL